MAHPAIPRRSSSCTAAFGSSHWIRDERYAELKGLEQGAKKSWKEIRLVQMDIREQTSVLEMLKKRDVARMSKIVDITRALEQPKGGDGVGYRDFAGLGSSGSKVSKEELDNLLARLRREHAGDQSLMEEMTASLEHKQSELGRLEGHHARLSEQIAKEEEKLQAAELAESLQQKEAVEHEMRSLTEDLRRLGQLMDLSSAPTAEQVKLQPARPQPVRFPKEDSIRGTRSLGIGSLESSSSVLQGNRLKEPAEFDGRESSTRKRPKNSSFSEHLGRLHEQREKLAMESQEKQMLLDSVARISNSSRDVTSSPMSSTRKGTRNPRAVQSLYSEFEGFGNTPVAKPWRTASAGSMSPTSDVSSCDTMIVKPAEGGSSSVVTSLSFAQSEPVDSDDSMLERIGTGSSCISTEDVPLNDDIAVSAGFEIVPPASDFEKGKVVATLIGSDYRKDLESGETSNTITRETSSGSPGEENTMRTMSDAEGVAEAGELVEERSDTPGREANGSASDGKDVSLAGEANVHTLQRYEGEAEIKDLKCQVELLQRKMELDLKLRDELKEKYFKEQNDGAENELSKQMGSLGDHVEQLRQNLIQLQQEKLPGHGTEESVHAELSARLQDLCTQVGQLKACLEEQHSVRETLEDKLDKEARERMKVEADVKSLTQAVAHTAMAKDKGESALAELVEQQKVLLVDQLKEAEKLRTVAEVRVLTLDKQAEQLERVCMAADNIQDVLKFQDKVLKLGVQTLIQILLLAVCACTLYSRVSESIRSSVVPT